MLNADPLRPGRITRASVERRMTPCYDSGPMHKLTRVDVSEQLFDVHRDLSVATRTRKPGPPERIDGMTLGIQHVTEDAPHGGEVHPDGDEILFVISGRIRVFGDSDPHAPLELGPGEACVVPKDEWHRVSIVEPTHLLNITPGPRGDHRPRR
jgi:mannose-6-phosphate isomerase-like protein (cupin superfamily)